MENAAEKNAQRYLGFAGMYDDVRPECPQFVVDCLTNYLGRRPRRVVDFGCGTGLSTRIWSNFSDEVIGIEPNEDMRSLAIQNAKGLENISFLQAFAAHTGLETGSADIVTCAQSFHWMEPKATLEEAARLLPEGGIFAAYDCDWPPVCKWEAEWEYRKLFRVVRAVQAENEKFQGGYVRWDKNAHMDQIKACGYFTYTREIVFSAPLPLNAERFIGLALSQGGLPHVMREDIKLVEPQLGVFIRRIKEIFAEQTLDATLCYRMRLGIR